MRGSVERSLEEITRFLRACSEDRMTGQIVVQYHLREGGVGDYTIDACAQLTDRTAHGFLTTLYTPIVNTSSMLVGDGTGYLTNTS